MVAKSKVRIINISRADKNSFPKDLRFPGVLTIEDEHEAKAVEEES